MKKLLYILFAFLLAALPFSSCTREEASLFDDSSANRLSAALKESTDILTAAPKGWLVQYYAGESTEKVGGVNYIFEFGDDGWVGVTSELAPDSTYRSLYRLIGEQGPILTFDTYNEVFHYLSEPWGSSNIYGYGGDYEFVVTKISAEEVILKGKRYGNIAVMRPFSSSSSKKDYLNSILAIEDDAIIYSVLELYKDNQKIGSGTYAGTYDAYKLKYATEKGDSTELVLFAGYTPDGITLYEPVDINGTTVSGFLWDTNAHTYTGTGDASNIVIKTDVSPTYKTYDDFLGTYTMNYTNYSANASKTVTLEKGVEGSSYLLKGLSTSFSYSITYKRATGTLVFPPQELTSQLPSYYLSVYPSAHLYPWPGGGSLYVTTSAGDMLGVNDLSGSNLIVRFVPDGSISAAVGLLVILTNTSGAYYFWNTDHCYMNMVLTKQ
ncbi:MAG: DUF4302 domain-containing protein [Dysgonamonadaceae bacterium]|jgi:hypothetical protein|nr:DUF4302 domain-containing protein [Dysgonamonadaceae bacterium]